MTVCITMTSEMTVHWICHAQVSLVGEMSVHIDYVVAAAVATAGSSGIADM